jgi:phage terminase large subunit-like protein
MAEESITPPPKLYRLFVGKEKFEFPYERLKSDAKLRATVEKLEQEVASNRLRYYVPACSKGKRDDDVVGFLNDQVSDAKIMLAPNGVGKTCAAMIDLLMDLMPCDPSWEIFTTHGVKWREWGGPKRAAIGTYQMALHKRTIWPELKKWVPRDQLAVYVKKDNKGKVKSVPWDRDPHVELKCGSTIYFMAYDQDQQAFESFGCDIFLWDEQPPESHFDGADERVRRRNGRHIFSLTPHKVQGNPHTGAGTWLHKFQRGENAKGHLPRTYSITVDEASEEYYLPEMKAKAFEKWVATPQRNNDLKTLREGRSRYYGEWHQTSGLVYDEIEPEVHFIEPFKIDSSYTLYRALDHGTKNPTACLYFAVDHDGFIYGFREYYQRDKSIYENVKGIVDICGNELISRGPVRDGRLGIELQRFEENMRNEVYFRSVLDARSFAQTEMGREIGWIYNAAGIHVVPASAKRDDQRIPMVKELLRINPDLTNPITGRKGSPRMFFFKTLRNFIAEWQDYVWMEGKPGANAPERPKDKDNHLVGSCLSYAAQIPMRYMGEYGRKAVMKTVNKQTSEEDICETTGY